MERGTGEVRKLRLWFRVVPWLTAAAILVFGGRAAFPYPVHLRPVIRAAAQRAGVSPDFVVAVIQTESHFRPDAVSSTGAMGLMQIMPATGRWLWPKVFPHQPFRSDALADPATNIALGAFYLGILRRDYSGNMSLALAAYNGGQVNVKRWLRQGRLTSEPFLQTVSYPETKRFVIKVWVAYEIYRVLYPATR